MSNTNTNTVTIKRLALKQEEGRRAKNKVRKAKGEKRVGAKAYYFAALSAQDIAALRDGQTVTKEYGSGRTESYVLATR